ncbi:MULTISPECIES: TetR/AcrR family transcriptional regulator [Solirubrobacterales]|nr:MULTISPECIES: TetR/AcrR family transcriptional regulator [Solirubrobacterales]
MTAEPRRLTRAQQRVATRTAILDATGEVLVADGYAELTTRRVAELAGVAQSTLMHHFPTREALLVETVSHLAMRLADEAIDALDLVALREPAQRETVLDQAWAQFTSPVAIAAAQLWAAAWAEPQLAAALHELEQRLGGLIFGTAATLFPDISDDPRFRPSIDAAVSLIRGLVMAIPVSGAAEIDARWAAMKPVLADVAGALLDG